MLRVEWVVAALVLCGYEVLRVLEVWWLHQVVHEGWHHRHAWMVLAHHVVQVAVQIGGVVVLVSVRCIWLWVAHSARSSATTCVNVLRCNVDLGVVVDADLVLCAVASLPVVICVPAEVAAFIFLALWLRAFFRHVLLLPLAPTESKLFGICLLGLLARTQHGFWNPGFLLQLPESACALELAAWYMLKLGSRVEARLNCTERWLTHELEKAVFI